MVGIPPRVILERSEGSRGGVSIYRAPRDSSVQNVGQNPTAADRLAVKWFEIVMPHKYLWGILRKLLEIPKNLLSRRFFGEVRGSALHGFISLPLTIC